MPANPFNAYTDYGIGIGLRVPHYRHILEKKPVVDWFEIISENFMVDGGRPLEVLDSILEQYRVVQHGVAIYFGSADKLNRDHLKKLKRLVKRTNTPWLSDHLCWGSVDGRYTHDLLPMPYTFAAARVTAQKIREARDFLEVPICVENVSSYAEFHASEMTEWEFLSEVVELADCGILLDVNNIYVSSQNHNFDPYDYLNNIPHHRVGQIHIAGHSKFEKYILDTHDHPVLDPVWKMYAHAIRNIGHTATLLEWDDRIPSFDEVHNEALKAVKFQEQHLAAARCVEFSSRADLLDLQRAMAGAIFRPLTARWRMQSQSDDGRNLRAEAAGFIKPNDRLSSFERLEIYNRQYWFRLLDCLYDDYPGSARGARRAEISEIRDSLPRTLSFGFLCAARSWRAGWSDFSARNRTGARPARHWRWIWFASNGRRWSPLTPLRSRRSPPTKFSTRHRKIAAGASALFEPPHTSLRGG